MKETLAKAFKELQLNDYAAVWLLDLWDLIQEIDDIADGETCDYKKLSQKVFNHIPNNPWYQNNIKLLAPVVSLQMYKWFAANAMESKKEDFEKAYMLRAGYYDVVLYVVSLHGEIEHPEIIMNLYGEKFEEYIKEFKNA